MKSSVTLQLIIVASFAENAHGFFPAMLPPTATSSPHMKKSQHQQVSSLQGLGQDECDADSVKAGGIGEESRRAFLEKAGAVTLGGVAWTTVTDEASAEVVRPSARGLAEATIELTGANNKPIEVSVLYPRKWIVTKIPGKQISIQNYRFTDRAFSLSAPLPAGTKDVDDLPLSFFTDLLFDLNGVYGNFGKVDDFKIVGSKKLAKGKRDYRYVDLKFAALTQNMMQVERRACVASTIVGGDVVVFTASVLATRWPKISDIIGEMVESYRAELPQKTRDPSSLPFNRL